HLHTQRGQARHVRAATACHQGRKHHRRAGRDSPRACWQDPLCRARIRSRSVARHPGMVRRALHDTVSQLPGRRELSLMTLILAIIQPSNLEAVKEALNKVEVFRLTIAEVQGFGRQKGHSEVYRGHELTVNLLRKVQLEIAVNEDFVEPTVNAIMEAGRT